MKTIPWKTEDDKVICREVLKCGTRLDISYINIDVIKSKLIDERTDDAIKMRIKNYEFLKFGYCGLSHVNDKQRKVYNDLTA